MGTDSPEEKRPTTPVDFDKLHESLRESSARLSRSLVTFVLALLYLLITVASTTDLQLLLPDSRVKLPVLSVELDLFGFFIIAPTFVLILHFSFLLHLLHHVRKLEAWISATTKEQIVLLPSFIFNYTYTYSVRPKTMNYWLTRALQVVVLGLWPLSLLLYIQIRFADYHSLPMTAWHFVVVGLDVFILIVYWYRIINPEYLGERSVLRKILGLVPGKGEKKRPWIGAFLLGLGRLVYPSKENKAVQMYMRIFALALLVSAGCLTIVWMITTDRYSENELFLPRLDVQGEILVKSP